MSTEKFKIAGIIVLVIFLTITLLSSCDMGGDSVTDDGIHTLTLTTDGEGTVSLETKSEGRKTPAEGTHEFEEDTIVNIEAMPDWGWEFSHWEGEVSDEDSTQTSVLVDSDISIKAVFNEEHTNDYMTYEDDFISFQYPHAWQQEKEEGSISLYPDNEAVFMIERDSYQNNISSEEFGLIIQTLEEEWQQDYDVIGSGSRTVDNQEGWEFILESGGEAQDLDILDNPNDRLLSTNNSGIKMQVVVTYNENHLFMMVYANYFNNFDVYLSDIDFLIDSFSFRAEEDEDKEDKEDIEYTDEAKIVPQQEAENIERVSEARDQVIFAERTNYVEDLDISDVLVVEQAVPGADKGLLKRITGISGDRKTVEVEPAMLDDVIKSGDISAESTMTFDYMVENMRPAEGVTILYVDEKEKKFAFKKEFTGGITIQGHIKVTADTEMGLELKYRERRLLPDTPTGIKEFEFYFVPGFEAKKGLEIGNKLKWDRNYEIAVIPGPPMPIFGPLTLTPSISLIAGTQGEVEAKAETGISYDRSYRAGFHYHYDNGWARILEESGEGFQLNKPSMEGKISASVYAGPGFLGSAGVAYTAEAGLGVNLYGNMKAEGEMKPYPDWEWSYDLRMFVETGLFANLELIRLASIEWEGPSQRFLKRNLAYGASGHVYYEDEESGEDEALEGVEMEFASSSFLGGSEPVKTCSDGYWSKHLLNNEVTVTPNKEGYIFAPEKLVIDESSSEVNFEAKEEPVLYILPDSLEGETEETYEFELLAENIPEDISNVKLEWDFGDDRSESRGETTVNVSDEKAEYTIDHEYEEEGNFVLKASLYDLQGEKMAEAEAPVDIGLELSVSITGDNHLIWELEEEVTEKTHTFEAVVSPEDTGEYQFDWDFDDGSEVYTETGESSTVSHEYTNLKDSDEFSPKVNLKDLEGEILDEDWIYIEVREDEEDDDEDEDDYIIEFEDSNLEQAVRAEIQIPHGEDIHKSDVENLTSLEAGTRRIESLEGIQHLTNLKKLIIWENRFSDISPLANLTSLKELSFPHNEVNDISPLENLTSLERLAYSNNKASDISPLANLTSLKQLYLSHNEVSDISPLENLTSLERLGLQYNEVSDITPLANLTSLKELHFSENEVSDITTLANLTSLENLGVNRNKVSDISPLENLTKLKKLQFQENEVRDISALENLTSLWNLYFADNKVNDISPLVRNNGLGSGDIVFMRNNDLDLSQGSEDLKNIEILIERGVDVYYKPR